MMIFQTKTDEMNQEEEDNEDDETWKKSSDTSQLVKTDWSLSENDDDEDDEDFTIETSLNKNNLAEIFNDKRTILNGKYRTKLITEDLQSIR